jgi:hypothetical protein
MLMLILGAGASYDSFSVQPPDPHEVPGLHGRPPLASQLFHREFWHLARHRPCAALFPELERAAGSGTSIEETLEHMRGQAVDSQRIAVQLASLREYLSDLLFELSNQWLATTNAVTNYLDLFQRVAAFCESQREQVVIVSFNYDTVADDAYCKVWRDGRPLLEMEDYIASPNARLLKIHGSADWSTFVKEEASSREGTTHDDGAFLAGGQEWKRQRSFLTDSSWSSTQ